MKQGREGKLVKSYLCRQLELLCTWGMGRLCRTHLRYAQLQVNKAGVFLQQVLVCHWLKVVSEDLKSQHPQCLARELSVLPKPGGEKDYASREFQVLAVLVYSVGENESGYGQDTNNICYTTS